MLAVPERDLTPLDCRHVPFGLLEKALPSCRKVERPVGSGQAKVLEVDDVDVGEVAALQESPIEEAVGGGGVTTQCSYDGL